MFQVGVNLGAGAYAYSNGDYTETGWRLLAAGLGGGSVLPGGGPSVSLDSLRRQSQAAYAYTAARVGDVTEAVQALTSSTSNWVRNAIKRISGVSDTTIDAAENAGQFSRLVPGGGLVAHEKAGGHLIQRHIAKTDQELINRVNSNSRITGASSYAGRTAAEDFTARILDARSPDIANWIQSGPNRPKAFDLDFGTEVTGRYFDAQGINVIDVNAARVVLIPDNNLPAGFRIQTGFPRPFAE